MEEPVEPMLVERSEMQKLAAAIVESVRVNAKMPLPGLKAVAIQYTGVFFDALEVEAFVLKLAQEICASSTSRDTPIAHAEAPPSSKKTDINSAIITAWRAACDAATSGNWTSDEMTDGALWVQCERNDAVSGIFEHIGSNEADAAFVVLARKALPAALDRVEELEAVIAANLPHPNGPNTTTPGDADAWCAAMFNLGAQQKEIERLRGLLAEACEIAADLNEAPNDAWRGATERTSTRNRIEEMDAIARGVGPFRAPVVNNCQSPAVMSAKSHEAIEDIVEAATKSLSPPPQRQEGERE